MANTTRSVQEKDTVSTTPLAEDPAVARHHDALIAEYNQVTAQFRALTDIRFKLLGFLPLGTLASVLATSGAKLQHEALVDAFGLIVVACIATYNKRNDQLYNELVGRLGHLERELGLEHGSFVQRPKAWLRFGFWRIEHGLPVRLIYAASASVWAFALCAAVPWGNTASELRTWIPFVGAAVPFVLAYVLVEVEDRKHAALRAAVSSFARVSDLDMLERAIAASSALSYIDADVRARRFEYQRAQAPGAWPNDLEQRALTLAAVIDQPARWIRDVWSGRR